MQHIQPLESLEPLTSLETRLNPLFEKDIKKYYSNLDLVCMGAELLYQAHLLLEEIEKNKNIELEVNNKTMKAYTILNTISKNPIFWNDADIENDFKNMILGVIEEP